MLILLPRLALWLMAVLLLRPSGQAGIVAEHALPPGATTWFITGAGMSTDEAISDIRLAQVFTPLESGILDDISFSGHRSSSTNVDLRISIATVQGGAPGTTLASVWLPFTAFETASFPRSQTRPYTHTVDFTGNILLQAGTLYAIVFSTDTTEADYRFNGDFSGYTGGNLLGFRNSEPWVTRSGHLLFQVRTVAEPSVAAILGFAALLAATARRRTLRC
jgi:hypothetical protein